MRLSVLSLVAALVVGVVQTEETNLVEILRRFQAELDGRGPGLKPVVEGERGVGDADVMAGKPEGRHVLGIKDVVEVIVVDEPDMSLKRAEVGEDGTIAHALWGRVGAAGKALDELEGELRTLLAEDYLVDPRVQVRLLEAGRSFFEIHGQVRRPGTYSYAGGERVTLLRAIGMAGGATRRAELSRVRVRRVEDGRLQEVFVNLLGGEATAVGVGFRLRSGDVVEVLSQ
jgi:protein involved in polysaccharide export with SLBB domain